MTKLTKEQITEQILTALKVHGEMNLTEISKTANVSIASVYNYLNGDLKNRVELKRQFGTALKAVTKIYKLKEKKV